MTFCLTHKQEKIPTCGTEFHAANAAHSRGEGEGLSVSGVGGVSCARHMMVMALGDLQKGERSVHAHYHIAGIA
jgi:hypothetical protein